MPNATGGPDAPGPAGLMAAPGPAAGGLDHLAFFYHSAAGYLAGIEAFARAGLARGEAVLIAVPGHQTAALRRRLDGGSRHLRYTDMTELGRNPARLIPELRGFIDGHPGQRTRYVSEPLWPGRSEAETWEAARHDALINIAFAGADVTVLCAYDADRLAPSVLGDAERAHPAMLAGGQARATGLFAGPGILPAGCQRPLPAPPAGAVCLTYRMDLRPVRALVAAQAGAAGLSRDRAESLVLAASEVAANSIAHASGGGVVRVWCTGQEILCELADSGWIRDPLAGRRRRPPGGRGQGLWVVNQVCDLMELRTGADGTVVRLHMRLRED